MKKKARTLIILGAVLVLCIGAYIGVSVYTASQTQKTAAEAKASEIYAAGRGSPVNISYMSAQTGKTVSLTFEKDKWYVADNKDFPLNQSSVTGIASAIDSLSAVRTFDITNALSVYGLDDPAYTLKASDTAGNTMSLLIGTQNGDDYYAMTDGGNKIYTIPSALVSDLNTDITSMMTLDSIPVMSEKTINTIKLTNGTSSLTLDKHENKDSTYTWFIVNGTKYTAADEFVIPADTDTSAEKSAAKYISDAVTGLSTAAFSTGAAFRPTADELKADGLDVPQLTVTVDYSSAAGTDTLGQATTTKETVVLEIGGALTDSSGYYARIQSSQEIEVLPNETVGPLYEALQALGTVG
jgi:hypothetical protein